MEEAGSEVNCKEKKTRGKNKRNIWGKERNQEDSLD